METNRKVAGTPNVKNVILSGEEELRTNFTLKFAQAINRSEKNSKIRQNVKRTHNCAM